MTILILTSLFGLTSFGAILKSDYSPMRIFIKG